MPSTCTSVNSVHIYIFMYVQRQHPTATNDNTTAAAYTSAHGLTVSGLLPPSSTQALQASECALHYCHCTLGWTAVCCCCCCWHLDSFQLVWSQLILPWEWIQHKIHNNSHIAANIFCAFYKKSKCMYVCMYMEKSRYTHTKRFTLHVHISYVYVC